MIGVSTDKGSISSLDIGRREMCMVVTLREGLSISELCEVISNNASDSSKIYIFNKDVMADKHKSFNVSTDSNFAFSKKLNDKSHIKVSFSNGEALPLWLIESKSWVIRCERFLD